MLSCLNVKFTFHIYAADGAEVLQLTYAKVTP